MANPPASAALSALLIASAGGLVGCNRHGHYVAGPARDVASATGAPGPSRSPVISTPSPTSPSVGGQRAASPSSAPSHPEAAADALVVPSQNAERTSQRLRGGLFSPMPGGFMAGYQADTGLDIAGFRLPVYAVAAGTLDYSEPGHTRWSGRGDDDNAVRLQLDEPIPFNGRLITHVWYAHLFELVHQQPASSQPRVHVAGGERLGTSGMANGSPHLHLGLLLDNRVGQHWGTYLREDEIRQVLGAYRHKERLSPEPPTRKTGRPTPVPRG